MTVRSATPAIDVGTILPGADFADAYQIRLGDVSLDARAAAERMFGQSPNWIRLLMALRNRIVSPFGLKAPAASRSSGKNAVGIFPIVSQTASRLVAGLDDKHLDFRVVVDVAAAEDGPVVTTTTVVRTHNLLGRVYLTGIMPFHRLIVKATLRQIDR